MGMLGNFLSFIKGVEYHFEFQEGMWDFSRDAAVGKGLISRLGENPLVSLKAWREVWGSYQVVKWTSGSRGFPRAGAQGGNTSPRPTVSPYFCPFFFFWRGLGALAGGAVITHVPQGKREKAVAGRATPLPPRLQISSLPRFSACGEGGCPKDSDPHPARVLTWGLAGALLQGKWNNLFSIL